MIRINNNFINVFISSLLLFFIFIYYWIGGAASQALIVLTTCLLFLYIVKSMKYESLLLILSFFLFFLLLSLFAGNYFALSNVLNVFYGLSSIVLAYSIAKINNKAKFSLYVYIFYAVFCVLCIVYTGFDIESLNEVLNAGSRNVVSAILLLLAIFVSASYYNENKKQPLFVFIVTFILCIFLFGRTGIALSFLLLMTPFLDRFKNNIILFTSIFVLLLLGILLNIESIISFLTLNTSFQYGLESPRTALRAEYFSGILNSYHELFWGRNIDHCCQLAVSYNGNSHNSFILGHSRFGLLHTFIFLSIPFLLILKKQWFFLFLLLIIYIRYFFDKLGFFSPLDFVLFYLLILAFSRKSEVFMERV